MAQNDNNDSKKSVTGKIDRVLFLDSKSGRSILSVIREDGKSCRVIGNINGVEKDSIIIATGAWRKDEKYGWQFIAESIEEISQLKPEEPVEDGLMHALDFSNVLNKKHKKFRNVLLECDDYDEGDEDDIEFDSESPVQSETQQEKKDDKKQEERYTEKKTVVVDGALYNKDMSKLISAPKEQPSFSIPESVTFIGNGAFSDCKTLTAITIPASVEHIGDMVFTGCENLTSIIVDTDNKHYRDLDGVLYSHDLSQLIYVPNGVTSVAISELTTSIRYGAFRGCGRLKSLCVPETIEDIKHIIELSLYYIDNQHTYNIAVILKQQNSNRFEKLSAVKRIYEKYV